MPEEYFDVAYINFDEAILYGRIQAGRDGEGCVLERNVRVTLSEEQRRAIEDMNSRHQAEMQKLLGKIAHAEQSA